MPLDFGQPHLADLASWHGITPVPNDVLERHKQQEVARHPGSWAYRNFTLANILLPLGFIGSLALTGLSFVLAVMTAPQTASYLLLAIALGSLYVFRKISTSGALKNGLRVYGPAEWIEMETPVSWLEDGAGVVPRTIARTAKTLMDHGDMKLFVGRLVQDSKVLDPYLVIRRGNEQIVIGIWDENEIIQQASVQK